jgi:hypothetical protein
MSSTPTLLMNSCSALPVLAPVSEDNGTMNVKRPSLKTWAALFPSRLWYFEMRVIPDPSLGYNPLGILGHVQTNIPFPG